jgi:hypothetical protein
MPIDPEEFPLAVARAHRLFAYAALNLAFFVGIGIAAASGASQDPRILYLTLLFALCSSSLIDLDGLNGRYSLLGLFLLGYFVMFGVADLAALIQPPSSGQIPNLAQMSVLSATESVILVGGFLAVMSYRLMLGACSRADMSISVRDWPRNSVVAMGLLMWAVGTYAIFEWYVYIVPGTTNEEVRKGLQSQSTVVLSAYILAQMMQPLGILLIAYFWRKYRAPLLWALIAAIVILQMWIGFVTELKGMAMLAGILVIVTIVLTEGRIPKAWIVGAVLYVIVVFPVFQAYRAEVAHNRGIARTAVIANFGHVLEIALAAEDRVNSGRDRAQTFLERSSLLGSLQIIVDKAGVEVPYQQGHTLTPLLATFIPKIFWSDKPDVPTGQLMNKAFHITDSDDIFVSPSHLGELYWNFGWPGVVIGMSAIGAILGFIGGRFNLAQGNTVTRLLVTVVTIKQVVVGFESSIATIYVVWLRSLAGIGLLHLIFARTAVAPRSAGSRPPLGGAQGLARAANFPNLLT